MRRKILTTVFLGVFALAGCAPKLELPSEKLIDLTHSFDEQTIYWPTEKGFELEKGQAGVTEKGYYYAANRFCSAEHGGTHIDAPIHFFERGNTLDAIPLRQLIGHGVLIDVRMKCAENPNYQVVVDDLVGWERKHHEMLDEAPATEDRVRSLLAQPGEVFGNRGARTGGSGQAAFSWPAPRRCTMACPESVSAGGGY